MSNAVKYSKTSPYASTPTYSFFLDVATIPEIPYYSSDVQYEIDAVYKNRPDLLAYDLYSDPSLWWVFAVRNIEVIKDPIFDFVSGNQIYLPKKSTLTTVIGI
jgi:hypothetical protein